MSVIIVGLATSSLVGLVRNSRFANLSSIICDGLKIANEAAAELGLEIGVNEDQALLAAISPDAEILPNRSAEGWTL